MRVRGDPDRASSSSGWGPITSPTSGRRGVGAGSRRRSLRRGGAGGTLMPIATLGAQFASAISIMGGSSPPLFNWSASTLPMRSISPRNGRRAMSPPSATGILGSARGLYRDRHRPLEPDRREARHVQRRFLSLDALCGRRRRPDASAVPGPAGPRRLRYRAVLANRTGGRPQLSALSDQRGLQGAL